MSHLSEIISSVEKYGTYEEFWHILTNAYFRGEDCFEQIEQWANENNLAVSFSNENRTCTFRAIPDQAK